MLEYGTAFNRDTISSTAARGYCASVRASVLEERFLQTGRSG